MAWSKLPLVEMLVGFHFAIGLMGGRKKENRLSDVFADGHSLGALFLSVDKNCPAEPLSNEIDAT